MQSKFQAKVRALQLAERWRLRICAKLISRAKADAPFRIRQVRENVLDFFFSQGWKLALDKTDKNDDRARSPKRQRSTLSPSDRGSNQNDDNKQQKHKKYTGQRVNIVTSIQLGSFQFLLLCSLPLPRALSPPFGCAYSNPAIRLTVSRVLVEALWLCLF